METRPLQHNRISCFVERTFAGVRGSPRRNLVRPVKKLHTLSFSLYSGLQIPIINVSCWIRHARCRNALAVRPGGVSGYPRAWCNHVSWVRIPPSAYSYKIVGTFSCAQINLRKTREREFGKLDEKLTSSGIALNPMRNNY